MKRYYTKDLRTGRWVCLGIHKNKEGAEEYSEALGIEHDVIRDEEDQFGYIEKISEVLGRDKAGSIPEAFDYVYKLDLETAEKVINRYRFSEDTKDHSLFYVDEENKIVMRFDKESSLLFSQLPKNKIRVNGNTLQ
ncbi:MAG: hypothetical protein IE916_00500 [Epsilonproteobacteria bacterium]|nr:hypothetical protein [Campylobacterota bacterium]